MIGRKFPPLECEKTRPYTPPKAFGPLTHPTQQALERELRAARAEIERLKDWAEHGRQWNDLCGSLGCVLGQDKFDFVRELVGEAVARATAAEAERDRLRERIDAACEMAESFYHNSQGALWNYGTTPSVSDHAEWKGVRNTAQDLLYALDPDRALAAIDAALTEGKP